MPHLHYAPPQLRERMLEVIEPAPNIAQALADGAMKCLRAVMENSDDTLSLLAGDALFTHALQAAAEQGDAELERFTASLDATRFQLLLDPRLNHD
jgi:hypothetical protein